MVHTGDIDGAVFGDDIIDDNEGILQPHEDDVLRFTALNSADAHFDRDGTDLIITSNLTGETITVIGQFAGECYEHKVT